VRLARGWIFFVPDHLIGRTCGIGTSKFFGGPRIFCILRIFKPPFKRLGSHEFRKSLLSRNYCLVLDSSRMPKMSTSLKSPGGLKDAEWEKGQLSHRPPIPYVPVVDIVTPKEEPHLFKIKLLNASHLSIPFTATPVGTTRNTLHTSLQSSTSLIRRGCPRSAGCLPRLLQDG
jgi:hypothetical protein